MINVTHLPKDDDSCGWFHTAAPRQPRPPHEGVTQARWAVVGAGFTGLAVARRLATRFPDDEIVLLEAQQVGQGASGRNSGFAIDLPHDIGAPDYIGDLAAARMVLQLNRFGQSSLRDAVAEHGIDCALRSSGKYQAAVEDRGIAVLDAYRSGLEKLGETCEVVEAEALRAAIGTGFYRKALFTPGTMLLQPAALVMGLADTLPSNVSLYEDTPVTGVEYGNRITLHHRRGRIVADKLVLTNNASAMFFGFLTGQMLPVFTYGSLTRPLTQEERARLGGEDFWGLIPADPAGSTLRRTHDHRILVRNTFSYNHDNQTRARHVRRSAGRHRLSFERRFPMLPDVPFEYTWGGSLAMARNHQSQFGALAPNVYGALCCNGLGVTRGTASGTLLADWLAGDRSELIDFLLNAPGPNRNPPRPILDVGVKLNLAWAERRAGKER